MKTTGIIRRIDDIGRIVIPKEIRSKYNIPAGTPLELFTLDNDEGIAFKVYKKSNDIVKSAENFLRVEKGRITDTQAVFKIEGITVTCELIYWGKRRTGEAKLHPDDTFNPSVGMAISFMKAYGMNVETLTDY